MLEMIQQFLGYTGIHPETFGRLAVGDPYLVQRLKQPGFTLEPYDRERILEFIHRYEGAKE